jgi:hypothetical protein
LVDNIPRAVSLRPIMKRHFHPQAVEQINKLLKSEQLAGVERTCNARASGDRKSCAIQVVDPHVQIVRSEGAWFAMHVLFALDYGRSALAI